MGGSVVVGVACERRSTIASVEASPETARAKNIFIAEAERTQPLFNLPESFERTAPLCLGAGADCPVGEVHNLTPRKGWGGGSRPVPAKGGASSWGVRGLPNSA